MAEEGFGNLLKEKTEESGREVWHTCSRKTQEGGIGVWHICSRDGEKQAEERFGTPAKERRKRAE